MNTLRTEHDMFIYLKSIVVEVITALHDATYTVVAIVSDMGPTNQSLLRELGVSAEKPWFDSPNTADEKIFVFADVPHLLKLVRNHFIDTGFIYNGIHLKSQTVKELIDNVSSSDLSIVHKLTMDHLLVSNAGRQKVKLAAQLFSNTTANAVRRCYSVGRELYQPLETADFIQLINNWFDIFNSKLATMGYPGKKPYGKDLAYQNDILEKMDSLMANPIIPKKTPQLETVSSSKNANLTKRSVAPFQKGILMSNNALRKLHTYLKQKYNIDYILTYRLNQDILENFFGAIRSKGGLNDHPSPKDFKYRLRKYVLARNTELLNNTGNVERDDVQWLNCPADVSSSEGPSGSAETVFEELNESFDLLPSEEINTTQEFPKELQDLCEKNNSEMDILHEDALQYVAGYVIRKLNLDQCDSSTSNAWTWVDQVSKGGLKKPSEEFLTKVKGLENVFHEINGKNIVAMKNFQAHMLQRSSAVKLPYHVKKFFFKCRMHFRIAHLNKRIQIQKAKQRIMGNKKYIKIKL